MKGLLKFFKRFNCLAGSDDPGGLDGFGELNNLDASSENTSPISYVPYNLGNKYQNDNDSIEESNISRSGSIRSIDGTLRLPVKTDEQVQISYIITNGTILRINEKLDKLDETIDMYIIECGSDNDETDFGNLIDEITEELRDQNEEIQAEYFCLFAETSFNLDNYPVAMSNQIATGMTFTEKFSSDVALFSKSVPNFEPFKQSVINQKQVMVNFENNLYDLPFRTDYSTSPTTRRRFDFFNLGLCCYNPEMYNTNFDVSALLYEFETLREMDRVVSANTGRDIRRLIEIFCPKSIQMKGRIARLDLKARHFSKFFNKLVTRFETEQPEDCTEILREMRQKWKQVQKEYFLIMTKGSFVDDNDKFYLIFTSGEEASSDMRATIDKNEDFKSTMEHIADLLISHRGAVEYMQYYWKSKQSTPPPTRSYRHTYKDYGTHYLKTAKMLVPML